MNRNSLPLFFLLALAASAPTGTVKAMHPQQLKLLSEVSMPDVHNDELALEDNAAESNELAPQAPAEPETRWQKLKRWNNIGADYFNILATWHNDIARWLHQAERLKKLRDYYQDIGQYSDGFTTSKSRFLIDQLLIKAGISPEKISVLEGPNGLDIGDIFAKMHLPIAWEEGNSTLYHYPVSSSHERSLKTSFAYAITRLKNEDRLQRREFRVLMAFLVPYLLKKYSLIVQQVMTTIKNKIAPDEKSHLHTIITWIGKIHTDLCASPHMSLLVEQFLLDKLHHHQQAKAQRQATLLYPEYESLLIKKESRVTQNALIMQYHTVKMILEFAWSAMLQKMKPAIPYFDQTSTYQGLCAEIVDIHR